MYDKSTNPLNDCFQKNLGLLRPFAVSFWFCTTETTHSRDILLSDVLLSILNFFSILFDFAIFTQPSLDLSKLFFYFYIFWNLLYILFWTFAACSFSTSDWLKKPVLLYFERKSHIINQKSRALSEFSKITMSDNK